MTTPTETTAAAAHCSPQACSHGDLGHHHGAADAICVDHVSFRYGGAGSKVSAGDDDPGGWALRDVTLHIEHGCSLGIIGPNGAGKSTLLKIMLGLVTGYTGRVEVMGQPPKVACRRGGVVGYVPQRHQSLWRFPLSVRQVALLGLAGKTGILKSYSRDDRRYVDELLGRLGIAKLADRPIGDLSGGQQQRCFMARALAARPKILILDEPLVGVDEAGQRQFAQLSRDLHEGLGLTMVIVSHDIRAIASGCSRVACLNQTIHYHDAPAGLTQDVLREVFQHEVLGAI